jgi:sugar diacid utilization regulator
MRVANGAAEKPTHSGPIDAATPNGDTADSALIDKVLNCDEPVAERRAALRRVGLAPHLPLRLIAVSTEPDRDPAVETVALMAQERLAQPAHVGVIGGVVAVLFQHGRVSPSGVLRSALRHCSHDKRIATGIRIGVGGLVDSTEADVSWHQATVALRFATPRDASGWAGDPGYAVVDHDSLGSLAALAEVPSARLRGERDVQALDALAATENGALDIATLEAFCLTGSLRQAAEVLYIHHSTVAVRLSRVESALGWRLDDPADRFKAQFALLARRLAHVPEHH